MNESQKTSQKSSLMHILLACILLVVLLSFAFMISSCTHKPSDSDIKAAIKWRKKGDKEFIYSWPKDFNIATADYDSAIALNPLDTLSFQARGLIKIMLKRDSDAISDFNKVIEIDPNNGPAYNNRGYAYYVLGKTEENYQKAISDYDKGIKLCGRSSDSEPDKHNFDAAILSYVLDRLHSCAWHYRELSVASTDSLNKKNYVNREPIMATTGKNDVSSNNSDAMVRADGVYQSSKDEGTYEYLRFYSDGLVITAQVAGSDDPQRLGTWFNRNRNLSKGTYQMQGSHIKFSSKDSWGTINYDGEVNGDYLALKIHNLITGNTKDDQYKFKKIRTDYSH